MAHFFIGDTPSAIAVESDVNLTPFEGVTVTLTDPVGVEHPGVTAVLRPADGYVEVSWPSTVPLNVYGLWTLRLTLAENDGSTRALPLSYVVAEQSDGWHTIDSIREVWPSAPDQDSLLFTYLDAAKDLCIAKADPITGPVPQRYRLAQAMQVRAMWNSGHVQSSGQFGGDDQAVYAYSMGYDIVKLLRPSGAIGGMF